MKNGRAICWLVSVSVLMAQFASIIHELEHWNTAEISGQMSGQTNDKNTVQNTDFPTLASVSALTAKTHRTNTDHNCVDADQHSDQKDNSDCAAYHILLNSPGYLPDQQPDGLLLVTARLLQPLSTPIATQPLLRLPPIRGPPFIS